MVSVQRRVVPRVKLGPDARLLTLKVSSPVGIESRPSNSPVHLHVSKNGFETTIKPFCATSTELSFDIGNFKAFNETGLYTVIVFQNDCQVDHFEVERNACLQFTPKVSENSCMPSGWKDEECCDTDPEPEMYSPCQTTGGLSCGCGDLVRGGCPSCNGPTILVATSKLVGGRLN